MYPKNSIKEYADALIRLMLNGLRKVISKLRTILSTEGGPNGEQRFHDLFMYLGLHTSIGLGALRWISMLMEGRRPFRVSRSAGPTIGVLPPAPTGAKRSVLFLHNSYYHFKHLAVALRRRGWDALLVTTHDPASKWTKYYHGDDVSLFSTDQELMERRKHDLVRAIPDRFRLVHFSGMHCMSFFDENMGAQNYARVPWDFLEFKRRGVKIGYTVSGCNDGLRQSAFQSHTGVCLKCVWENRPDVCSDQGNHSWGDKLAKMCDLVACDEDFALEHRTTSIAFREPLTTCMDPEFWNPELPIPDRLRIPREADELLVLHGFGEATTRMQFGRDIKGSRAVIRSIDRLTSEGAKIKLINPTDVPSVDMRFLQMQADIVVDQLNYGRYGAQARESMMLGKPTICHINPRQGDGLSPLRCLAECPLVEADEESIYDVLKSLISSPQERFRIGELSRAYATKWHSADACAIRFEKVYDRIMQNLDPESDEVFADN